MAWVSNTKGVRNIMLAEPPAYQARKITAYTADDGQELRQLRFTPDASAVVYVRGNSSSSRDGVPNPALNPAGASEDVWIAPATGGTPRKVGEGDSPAISPKGDKVAFHRHGQLWWAPLDGAGAGGQIAAARGANGHPSWSRDGARIAFTSARGDHALLGVFEVATATLRYLDPSTDFDSEPEWSPDSRSVAFLRVPSGGLRTPREPHRAGEPWSIRVASVETGAGREIFRAREGAGSVFRGINARNQILWAEGNRLVFPWEADGWTHLYSVAAAGGKPVLLTPGTFEVEDAALAVGKREIVFSSNQEDIDRRHLWKVSVTGGAPASLTSGQAIECSPPRPPTPTPSRFCNPTRSVRCTPPFASAPRCATSTPTRDPRRFPTTLVTPRRSSSRRRRTRHPRPAFSPCEEAEPADARPRWSSSTVDRAARCLLGWHSMLLRQRHAMNQYLASLGYIVPASTTAAASGTAWNSARR